MGSDCFILWRGRRVALKWHRARRLPGDVPFTGTRIAEGLARGASVEVDANVTADGDFAILHDDRLDCETTGHGLVAEADGAVLSALRLRDGAGLPTPHPLMQLGDLADLLSASDAGPGAMLQIDLKTPAGALTDRAVRTFADAICRMRTTVILSSGDARAVARLAAACPGLRTGHDPCDDEAEARLRATGDFAGFVGRALADAPAAEMIYLAWPLVLAAEDAGFDLTGAFQAAGKRVDAWTIPVADEAARVTVRRLLDLGVDQITTDDPAGLGGMFGENT